MSFSVKNPIEGLAGWVEDDPPTTILNFLVVDIGGDDNYAQAGVETIDISAYFNTIYNLAGAKQSEYNSGTVYELTTIDFSNPAAVKLVVTLAGVEVAAATNLESITWRCMFWGTKDFPVP